MTSPLGSTADCFSGWANYPINIANQDDLIPSAASLNDRLTRLTKTLFSSTVDLHLIGIKSDGSITADTKHYDQETDVETAIRQDVPSPPRIRIVSLHSKKTPWEPKVTQRLMRKILTVYKVDPAFLHVLFSFGAVPHLAESGSSNLATSTTSDGSQNISYQFRYVEENHRSEIQPWSIRQTGIYHHHSASENFDFFIVLNPYPLDECAFGGQLLDLTRSHVAIESLLRHPYRLHALAFAAYLDNWRWYFRHLGEKFSKMNNRIMTLNLEPNIVGLTFDEVQGLRNLEDTALSLGGYCKSALSIVQRLQSIPETKFEQEWTLQPYSDRLGDFVESLSTLAARINNTIDLAAYFLDLKNQETAVEMNRAMSELTSKTNKDTTSVKWITYLTVIYLPASFVATLYGMNLFEFDEENHQLVISKDFWIYLATWLPLTFFTFLGYLMLKRFHEPEEYRVISRLKGLRSKIRARKSRDKGDPHQDVELSSSTLG